MPLCGAIGVGHRLIGSAPSLFCQPWHFDRQSGGRSGRKQVAQRGQLSWAGEAPDGGGRVSSRGQKCCAMKELKHVRYFCA